MGNLKKIFGDSARVIVLDYLLKNSDSLTYPSGIAESTGLSNSTVSRVTEPLLKLGILEKTGPGKSLKSLELNKDNRFTETLLEFYRELETVKP